MWNDLKYLTALSIPITAILALWLQGWYSYFTVLYAFGFIPLIELFTTKSKENLTPSDQTEKSSNPIFDWMLYINLPIIYGLLISLLYSTSTNSLATYELTGLILSVGIVLGASGINVAHELGHRFTKERFIAKALLLPCLYMHFFIEHNYGHHQNIATDADPATAKYNHPLYLFWITSICGQYLSAWKIQINLLKKQHKNFFSIKNDMFWYLILTFIYLGIVTSIFGTLGTIIAVLTATVGFLLLETINYIEHYGLRRQKKITGSYERVSPIHSWNSNHHFGRIILYELTRHSDHHHRAVKKYQLLDHHDSSPQLPLGYPGSMLLSMIPPLWFWVMNKRIPDTMKTKKKQQSLD